MGYLVSSIFSVSPNDVHEIFVYFIPGREPYYRIETEWINEWVHKSFRLIAERLGPVGVFIAPSGRSDSSFYEELTQSGGFKWPFSRGAKEEDLLFHEPFPFLLISKRPVTKEKSNENQSYYFNLVNFGSEKELAAFFDEIVRCVRQGRDLSELVDRFPSQKEAKESEGYGRVVEDLNSVLQLKPNVFGVGVNLNEAIDRFGTWLKKRKAEEQKSVR